MKLSNKYSLYVSMAALVSASIFYAPVQAKEKTATPPVATLSASSSVEVEQDVVQVVLAAQETGDSQSKVSGALNKKLDSVMKQAKQQKDIQAKSGAYRVWPTTNQDGKVAQWRGYAEIILESKDFEATSELAAKLSDRMPIDGISFSVSSEVQQAEEQSLLESAVKSFEARAQALTDALGFASYKIKQVDLGGSGNQLFSPMPKMLMAASADSAPAPIEGGKQNISVSIQGEIYLLNTTE